MFPLRAIVDYLCRHWLCQVRWRLLAQRALPLAAGYAPAGKSARALAGQAGSARKPAPIRDYGAYGATRNIDISPPACFAYALMGVILFAGGLLPAQYLPPMWPGDAADRPYTLHME